MSSTDEPPRSEPQLSQRRSPWLICAGLIVVTLAVFAQTFAFGFLNFDDDLFVSANPKLAQGLSAQGVTWAFTANLTNHDPHAEYWEPLTLISRLADVQFFGQNAGAHHRTNVLLHLLAGLVLFGGLRALLQSDLKSGVIAALFLIHPLHVEPVAWLSARKDVLNGLFFFATLWAYAEYVRRPGWRRYTLVCLAFLCANMAKPMAVSLPFVLLLLDIWPLGRMPSPLFGRAGLRILLEKVPLLVLAVAVAILAMVDQQQHGAVGDDALYPFAVRLGNAAISYCAYLGQTFLPVNLAIYYPHPGTKLSWGLASVSIAVLLSLSILCVAQVKRRPWLFVGWFWFIGVLLPVSGIVQIGEMARADRYTYVALVGIFLLCVEQCSELILRYLQRLYLRGRSASALTAAVCLIIFAYAGVAWAQTRTWHDSVPVFRHAIAATGDNYVAQANLGSALNDAGDRAGGLAHYNEAIRLHAPELEFHRRAGLEAEQRSDLAGAIQHYSKILTLTPWDVDVRQELGGVLLRKGDYNGALFQYSEALRYQRNAIPPRLGVVRVLIAQQRLGEARALLEAILRVDAQNHEAATLLRTLP